MTTANNLKAIGKILDKHNIPYKTENGHIIADTMTAGTALFEETVDLTNYSKHDLYIWLGY